MTRRTFKRGIGRLWIVLAVGFDLWWLVLFIREFDFGKVEGAWVAFLIVAFANVAWFFLLKAFFWILDGFSKENL